MSVLSTCTHFMTLQSFFVFNIPPSLCSCVVCLCWEVAYLGLLCVSLYSSLSLHTEACALCAHSVTLCEHVCWSSLSTAHLCKSPSLSSVSHWKEPVRQFFPWKTSPPSAFAELGHYLPVRHLRNNQNTLYEFDQNPDSFFSHSNYILAKSEAVSLITAVR